MSTRHLSRWFLLFALSLGSACGSTAVAADNWTGSVRCEIDVSAPGYSHQETQTWTLTGGAPTLTGSYQVFPATWTVTGQGWHDRTGQTARRIARWSANVPGSNAPKRAQVAFLTTPSGQLFVSVWHAQMTVSDGYRGTEQYINLDRSARPPTRLVATLYEWRFQKIEAMPTDTEIVGSATMEVKAGIAPMHPGDAQVMVTCTWSLAKGGTPPPLPPSSLPPQPAGPPELGGAPPTAGTPPAGGAHSAGQPGTPSAGTPATPGAGSPAPGSPPAGTPSNPGAGGTVPGGSPGGTPTSPTARLVSLNPNSGGAGLVTAVQVVGENTHWQPGITTANFGPGITIDNVQVNGPTSASIWFRTDATAALGARTVTLTTGPEVVTLANAFTVKSAVPAIALVDPTSKEQGFQNLWVMVRGEFTHFAAGSTTLSFGPGITVASPTVHTATGITAFLNIAPDAAVGPRELTVTTGAEVVKLANAFTVTAGSGGGGTPSPGSGSGTDAARLLSISPTTIEQGAIGSTFTLVGQGTHWSQGAPVVSVEPGIGVPITNAQAQSDTNLLAQFDVQYSAAPGARTVTVTNGSEVVTLPNAFTITPREKPELLSITPNRARQGAQNVTLQLTGKATRWAQGVTTFVIRRPFDGSNPNAQVPPDHVTTASLTVHSPTSATAVVNVAPDATPGAYWASIFGGPASDWLKIVDGFTVEAATGGSTPPGGSTTPPPGVPKLLSVSPTSIEQGANAPATLTGEGTHWQQGTTAVDFGAGIYVQAAERRPSVTSPTSLSAPVYVGYDAAPGPRAVTVTTGSETVTLPNALTIVAREEPRITQISPNTQTAGAQNVTVTFTGRGTRWEAGKTSLLLHQAPGVTQASSLNVTSPTSMTVNLSVDPAAAPGPRTIGVLNSGVVVGSDIITVPDALTITPPRSPLEDAVIVPVNPGLLPITVLPPITAVTPNTADQWTQNLTITVTGRQTNFVQGATSIDLGPGVVWAGDYFTVESPTRVLGSFSIAGDAAPGPRTVTVRSGGETLTLPNGFTVTPRAARDVCRLTPETGQQRQQTLTVAISTFQWRYFQQGTTADFGPGITVTSFETQSEFAARAVIQIDSGAVVGPRSVTLRRPDGRTDTFADIFTVTAAPPMRIDLGNRSPYRTIDSIPTFTLSPNQAVRGSTNVYVMITGHRTNFVHPVTTADFGPGVTVNFVEVPEAPLQAKAVVTIAANATPGKRTVTLTTGNEVVTLADGFLVKGAATPPQAANDQFSVRRDRRLVAGSVLVNHFDGLASNASSPTQAFARAGQRVFFQARKGTQTGLWSSDGTPAGTRFVAAVQPWSLTGVGNRVFFIANQAGTGEELWSSDGTAGGTAMVKDIRPGPDGASILGFFDAGDLLYFVREISASGVVTTHELWRSDGTAAGTVPVKTNVSLGNANHVLLARANGTVYFVGNERAPGSSVVERWLWKTDGTAAGTVKVREMTVYYSGARDSAKPIRGAGNQLFVVGHNPTTPAQGEPDLWRSDGTAQGTVRLVDINPNPGTSVRSLIDLVAANNAVFFTVLDCLPGAKWELWRSDGTPGGTVLLKGGLNPGGYGALFPTVINGQLYFHGSSGPNTRGLWKSDGTPAGTTLVKAVALPYVAWQQPAPQPIVGVDGTVFFAGENPGLWKSDGTAAGTVLVHSLVPSLLTDAGDALLYRAPLDSNAMASNGLWTAGAAASLTANDTGPMNVPLKVALVAGPAHGTLTLAEHGGFIYQPNAGYTGSDQFTYTVTDGADTSNPATVTINVTAI